ncbi:MAG: endonuclease domain-containing protein [Candidatus Kerfeldbacteria bacterium]|nr:endonuclease domain-containing protein [Candidatus Kerfeldbacteria bacterium]
MTIIFNTHSMKKRRQQLRRSAPRAELLLWRYLKGKQLGGYKFRRQHSIGGYVVDFYCPELRLVIEVDGPSHYVSKEAREYDRHRQKYIESLRITVLRFTNADVYVNMREVIDMIYSILPRP